MSTIKRFEDLKAWQAARALVKVVFTESKKGELSKDFGTKDQIRRATLSIMNNIAEGFGKTSTKEFIRYLSIAESSAAEVKSMVYVLDDMDYLEKSKISSLHSEVDEVRKMIRGFIKYLNEYKSTQVKN